MQGRGSCSSRWTEEKLQENVRAQSFFPKINRSIRKNPVESFLITNSRLELRRHWSHTKSCCFRQWPLFKHSAILIVIKLIVAGYFSNYTNLRCCVWGWSGFIRQSSESPGTNSAWEPQINRFSLIPSTNDHCLSRFWLICSYSCTNCWHWAWLTWLKLRGEKKSSTMATLSEYRFETDATLRNETVLDERDFQLFFFLGFHYLHTIEIK